MVYRSFRVENFHGTCSFLTAMNDLKNQPGLDANLLRFAAAKTAGCPFYVLQRVLLKVF